MKPINFKQSTKVLQKPGTLSDSECGTLPVWCDGKQCVSCWKPSFKERINILFGGKVWLGVMSGKTQPPVFVAGERVFQKTPFLAHLRAFFVSIGEVIAKASKSLAEAAKMPDKRKHYKVGMAIGLIVGVISAFYVGLAWGALTETSLSRSSEKTLTLIPPRDVNLRLQITPQAKPTLHGMNP